MAGMALSLQLDRESPVPLARQIQEQIERLIREGWLAPGVKLPATRELAQTLGVNRTTVALAYEELVAAGRARAHVGQGTFVAAPPAGGAASAPAPPAACPWTGPACSRGAPTSAARGPSAGRPCPAGARPADLLRRGHARQRALPHRRVPAGAEPGRPGGGRGAPPVPAGRRRLSAAPRVPGQLPPPVRRRGARRGDPDRQRLAAGLRPDRADVPRSGRLGGDGAADLSPRHAGLPGVRGPARCPCPGTARARRPRPWGGCWSGTARSSSTASRAPTIPTGLTMTPAARAAAPGRRGPAPRADRRGRLRRQPLLRRRGRPRPAPGARPGRARPLHRHVLQGAVPGSPAGMARGAAARRRAAPRRPSSSRTSGRARSSRPPSIASASGACSTATSRESAASTTAAAAALIEALGRHMPDGVSWTEPRGGFSLLLTLPAGCDAAALLPRALRRGVGFTPGARFFLDGSGERTARLSFSSVPVRRIDDGVRRLAETIADWRRTKSPRAAPEPTEALVV